MVVFLRNIIVIIFNFFMQDCISSKRAVLQAIMKNYYSRVYFQSFLARDGPATQYNIDYKLLKIIDAFSAAYDFCIRFLSR